MFHLNGELVITNARIVTDREIVDGHIRCQGGRITDLDPGPTAVPDAVSLDGDWLLPGLIDIHTDNLESHMSPRPGVVWPSALGALLGHDLQLIGAGITTVLDSVSIGEIHGGSRRFLTLPSIRAIRQAVKTDILRSEHLIHLRCEVTDPDVFDGFLEYVEDPLLRLVSVMDHTPGVRQFKDPDKFREFYRNLNWTDEEFETVVREYRDKQRMFGEKHRRQIAAVCRERSLPLAGHDDATEDHVLESAEDGAVITEFPTTRVAAVKAREVGLHIVMGAPNVVRGQSSCGNVSARELAAEGMLDILTSDYLPGGLITAVFTLHHELKLPMPHCLASVTSTPARLLGLDDRGCIAPGFTADLVQVREMDGTPVVRKVWRRGERVF